MALTQEDREYVLGELRRRRSFYARTSFWAFWCWRGCQVLTVLGSAGGSLAAALVLKADDPARIWAITLSALATVAATLLATMKFGEHHRVREIALIGLREAYVQLNLYFRATPVGDEDLEYIRQVLRRLWLIEFDQVKLMKLLEDAALHQNAAHNQSTVHQDDSQ